MSLPSHTADLAAPERGREAPDLRMAWLACAAWCGGLVGLLGPDLVVVGVLGLVLLLLPGLVRVRGATPTRTAAVLVLAAVLLSAWARSATTAAGPVAELASAGAWVEVELVVTSDPRPTVGPYGDQVVVRGSVRRLTGRGERWRVRSPVVVIADAAWLDVPLGATVAVEGRMMSADGDVSGLLRAREGSLRVLHEPDVWWRSASVVRAGIRTAVAPRPEDQRVLVPSLVVGDDAGLDPGLAEDFRTTGLTHLLAVSGTNLTLLVGFGLVLGRLVGVRGRGRYVLGAAGIVGFVLLARTEPSVVRAAAMGAVALLAFTSNGRDRGIRTLGTAVVVLLLVDPRLAVSVGFTLSVLATAGILLLAPHWRDATRRWLPRWAAEAVMVPAAAQLACTPVVAAISGQVSLVAVLANLMVAPAVAPATVLGLAGGLCAVVWPALGQLVALPAAWSVAWIIAVARWGASLPMPAVGWGTGPVAVLGLTVLCVVVASVAPRLLASPAPVLAVTVLTLVVVLLRPPTAGWPPPGWILAVCDVGQGDALVVRAGARSALVVDAGPEPAPVDRCLDRLGITEVPLLVLTHFHLDHVGGLAGVLEDRTTGEVRVSPVASPAAGAAETLATLAEAGLAPVAGSPSGTSRFGEVAVQQLWPPPQEPSSDRDGDLANDASVVLLVEVRGIRMLLTGDVEPTAQHALARLLPDVEVDVLKVPHHGSRHQDEEFLGSLQARVALVSVGADNTYGHPAPDLLRLLAEAGTRVLRTDTGGDLVVVERDGELGTVTLR